jgi:hypothetical protein
VEGKEEGVKEEERKGGSREGRNKGWKDRRKTKGIKELFHMKPGTNYIVNKLNEGLSEGISKTYLDCYKDEKERTVPEQ